MYDFIYNKGKVMEDKIIISLYYNDEINDYLVDQNMKIYYFIEQTLGKKVDYIIYNDCNKVVNSKFSFKQGGIFNRSLLIVK